MRTGSWIPFPILSIVLLNLLFAKRNYPWDYLASNISIGIFILAILLIAFLTYKTLNIEFTPIDACFLLFCAWLILSSFLNNISIEYLYPIFIALLFYSLSRFLITEIHIINIFYGLIALGLVVASYALFQIIGIVEYRLKSVFCCSSFFDHPAPLAGFLAISFPISLYLCIQTSNRIRSKLYLLLLIIPAFILLIVILTKSRAGTLAALIGGISLVAFYCNDTLKKRKLHFKHFILALGILGFLAFAIIQIRPVSAWGRLFVWRISSQIIKENPITGIGFEHFSPVYMLYQATYFKENTESYDEPYAEIVKYAFNDFIRIGSESGITGLALFVLLVGAILHSYFKRQSRCTIEQKTIIAAIISFIIFSFFSYPLSILPISLVFVLFVALTSSCRVTKQRQGNEIATSLIIKLFLVTLLLILGRVFFYKLDNVKLWQESVQSIAYQKELSIKNLQQLYENDLANYGPFLYDYGTELVRYKLYKESIPVLETATRSYTGNEQYLFLGEAYLHIGDFRKAEESFNTAHFMKPFALSPLDHLMTLYLYTGEIQKAKSIAKHVLNIPIKGSVSENKTIMLKAKQILNL